MTRFIRLCAVLAFVVSIAIGGSSAPVAAHGSGGCSYYVVRLYDNDDLTGLLWGAACVGAVSGDHWSFDLPPYNVGNRTESLAITNVQGLNRRFTLFDGGDGIWTSACMHSGDDFHIFLGASIDNKADWLAWTSC